MQVRNLKGLRNEFRFGNWEDAVVYEESISRN
jgi:hypothetical protein